MGGGRERVQGRPFQSFFNFFENVCRFGPLLFVLLVETNKKEIEMLLQIAPLYAAILAVIFLVYTMRVIKARSAAGLSILHGDDMDLALKVRIHANFAEFVPIALIVLMLAEMSGGNGLAVHIAGAMLVASRIFIPFGMDLNRFDHPLRIIGNLGTHISIVISVVLIGIAQFS